MVMPVSMSYPKQMLAECADANAYCNAGKRENSADESGSFFR